MQKAIEEAAMNNGIDWGEHTDAVKQYDPELYKMGFNAVLYSFRSKFRDLGL